MLALVWLLIQTENDYDYAEDNAVSICSWQLSYLPLTIQGEQRW